MSVLALALVLGSTALEAERSARLVCPDPASEVGQPMHWQFEVRHALEERPDLEAELKRLEAEDPAWALLEVGPSSCAPDPGDPQTMLTRAQFVMVLLEAGEHSYPSLSVDLGAGGRLPVELPASALQPDAILGAEENQARPLVGLRDAPQAAAGARSRWTWIALGLLLCAAFGAGCWWWRRRRPAPAAGTLAPLAELEFVRGLSQASQVERRAAHFTLTRLVRRAFAGRLALANGATDEEWLLAAEQQRILEPEQLERARALFAQCALVKYAGLAPTSFALEASLEQARVLLEACASQEAA